MNSGLFQRRLAFGNGWKNNKNDKIWFYRWISVPRNLFMMMSSNSKAITGHLNSWHDWFFFCFPSDAKQDEHFAIFTFIIFIVINMFFLHLIIIIQKRSMPSSYNCWDIKYGCVLYCVLCFIVLSRRQRIYAFSIVDNICVCVYRCGTNAQNYPIQHSSANIFNALQECDW